MWLSLDESEVLEAVGDQRHVRRIEGWYQVETFGLMAPIATALVAVVMGARALAGEEHVRTMGLLLANPITRRRVVLERLLALIVHAVTVGFVHIAAASLQVTLLGILFGTLALATSAATGSVRAATTTIGAFGAAYAGNSILAVADDLDGWKRLSPFDWYLGDDPLVNGFEWSSVALFVLAAIVLFDRRDLQHG